MASSDEVIAVDAENTSLRSLVHHAGSVDCETPLEQVLGIFGEQGVDFLAITNKGVVSGVCSRLRLGAWLGSRFGFALYSRSAAHLAQVEHPLVFAETTSVRHVLDAALARRGDEFHEDVILVGADHSLLGLIPVDALARLQTRLVSDQLAELRRQHLGLFQAQQALRQSNGLYLGLFENHALGVALLDENGTVLEYNRRLAMLFNFDAERGRLASLSAWIADAERTDFVTLLRAQSRDAAAPATREFTLTIPGFGVRRFRCSTGWIRETGQICACLDDITEQRAIERHLLRQEKQTLLDTLVGGIAHELNNKLTPVHGFSELIAMGANEQTRQYADLITRSVSEAAGIIRQLLQLSKPPLGAEAVQTVDLRNVVEEALSMLRFKIRESRCAVRPTLPPEPVQIRADPSQLKQVVMNLMLNALQAIPAQSDARIEISVSVQGEHARLAVVDNGIGILPENLGRIFDPFFTTKGPDRGTGLGLSVCFSIVRQHGGDIAVRSEPGKGAAFTVTLPVDTSPPQILLLPNTPAARPRLTPGDRGARVLVVEDEIVVRRLMCEMLVSQFGCCVIAVVNGVEALERLAAETFSLVISDIRMPAMNGTELFLWLRETQPALSRRFVFVTGHVGENAMEEEISRWGVPVLEKPFSVARFVEVCGPFLRTGPTAGRPADSDTFGTGAPTLQQVFSAGSVTDRLHFVPGAENN